VAGCFDVEAEVAVDLSGCNVREYSEVSSDSERSWLPRAARTCRAVSMPVSAPEVAEVVVTGVLAAEYGVVGRATIARSSARLGAVAGTLPRPNHYVNLFIDLVDDVY
jgi:hypothetical protein